MRKLITFIPVWILYYVGHLTSKSFPYFGSPVLYLVYNHCMLWSGDMQKWSGLKRPFIAVENLEIERRWILKCLPENVKFDDMLLIRQYYTPEGRYRISYNGSEFKYYHTVKKTISHGTNEEIEREITRGEMDFAVGIATSSIMKHRYKLKIDGLVYEFDGLLFDGEWQNPTMWILEIELKHIDQKIDMPQFVKDVIVKEITGDMAFSNKSMSTKINNK
jgi:CYTH domain-containing protein